MKQLLLIIALIASSTAISQYIYHPKGKTTGIAKVESGKTYHYFDDGGPENYTPRTNSILTIYPKEEGQYVSLKVNSFEVGSDVRMYFFDGNHSGATLLEYVDIHNSKGMFTVKPGQVIKASSENKSGAISIKFVHANKRATKAGWDFEVTCSSTPGSPPKKTSQDCAGAIKVCSDKDLTTKSSGCHYQELPGPGFWNIILNYGNDGENQSNWYKFEVKTGGQIEFLIKPHKHTDFDWVLYGPFDSHECPCWTNSRPLRLSAGDGNNSTTGITGLSSRATDEHEDSPGDGFLKPIQVRAGEHYVLMIDDWSGNSTTFDLAWTFKNGASLECKADKDPPPVPDEDDVEIEIVEVDDPVDTTTTVVEVDPCTENNMALESKIIENDNPLTRGIDVSVTGGKTPYNYQWVNPEGKNFSTKEDLDGVPAGIYKLEVTDANNCLLESTITLTIEFETDTTITEPEIDEPKLEAELSEDEQWVTVKYPGPFEWKIENMEGETVRTGNSVDTEDVDVSNLPKGQYRVSLIYKQIKQYTTFYKK